ncbi:MAG: DUF4332 domain-containing protein [Bacteroidota bacterium]
MKLLELGELFALPIQSAVKAQNLAHQETLFFIDQFGIEDGKARSFRLKTERTVEMIDPKTGSSTPRLEIEPFELSIPLLAMLSPPVMSLKEMNVEFAVEVVEPKTEDIKSPLVPSKLMGKSLSSSRSLLTPLGQSNPTTMKVNMKIVRETPEGMARLGDLLTELLSGRPQSAEQPKKGVPVAKVHGIGSETAAILEGRGIHTATDLVSATETKEAIDVLAKAVGVSAKRIVEWREKAKLMKEQQP